MNTRYNKLITIIFILLFAVVGLWPERVLAVPTPTAFWKLDEASGTRADSVGGANNLTDSYGMTSAPGRIGQALVGQPGKMLIAPNSAALSVGNTNFTIGAWVYLPSNSTGIIAAKEYKGGGGWRLMYDAGSTDRFRFHLIDSSGAGIVEVKANNFGKPLTNTWYYVVAWHDTATGRAYIQVNNGNPNYLTVSSTVPEATVPLSIGARHSSGGPDNDFPGRIDEVGFWGTVLTASERTELYNNGAGLTYPPPVASGNISASPNPCNIVSPATTCTSYITWSTSGVTSANVYVSVNSGAENLFASQLICTGMNCPASWIAANTTYDFNLRDTSGGTPGTLLSTVRVTGNPPAFDACTIDAGQSINLNWTSANATDCTVYADLNGDDIYDAVLEPTIGTPPGLSATGVSSGPLSSTTTYKINCNGLNGNTEPADTLVVTVIPPPPPAVSSTTVTVNNFAYCGSGVHATVSWSYSDPVGSPQLAYQVQINDGWDGSLQPLGTAEWDSGVISSAGTSNSTLPCNPVGACTMTWNTVYRAWVMVQNGAGVWSPWTLMGTYCNGASCGPATSWITPAHAFPQSVFGYTPPNPTVASPITFTDGTIFAAGSINRTWSWNFGGGSPGTATGQGPQTTTYSSMGSYSVVLTSGDDAGSCTSTAQIINIMKQVPRWREIAPR